MADLDFKRSVQEIPAPEKLPQPYQRSVSAETFSVPDYQSAVSKYAASANWMSNIGSFVASKASNAIAQKLGYEYGKNPQGDLGMPLTDFDKVMQKSYITQAASTLGVQANQLITNTNLQLAKLPRITPEQLAKAHQSVSLGLQNIFKNAPEEIRPDLEYRYNTAQLNQMSDLTERMIREQRQDQRNNTDLATKNHAENAGSFALHGNFDAAEKEIKAAEAANKADLAIKVRSPLEADTNIETVRKSYINNRLIHEYEQHRQNKTDAKFLKDIADKKPDYIPDKDLPGAISNLFGHINQQESLRAQDQNLAMADFKARLLENPTAITGSDIAELNSHLTPLQQAQMNLDYINAMKRANKQNQDLTDSIVNYTNVEKMANASPEQKNKAWEATYKKYLERPESVASGMTEDTAKMYAAAASPVAIPAYNAELSAKLRSGNPNDLEAASQAYNYFSSHNMNHLISGVGLEEQAMADVYGQLRNIYPPLEAAQKAHEAIFAKGKAQKEANQEALTDYYQSQKNKKESNFAMIRRLFDISSDTTIRNLPAYDKDAKSIFETFFKITNGDVPTTTRLSKQYLNTQYGISYINGAKELTLHPIESLPNIPHGAIGAIQSDIVDQANQAFTKDKQLYDQGKSDHWFEARQRITPSEAQTSKKIVDAIYQGYKEHPITNAIFDVEGKRKELSRHEKILKEFNKGPGIILIRHNRDGSQQVYEGMVQANPWGKRTGNPMQPVAGGYDIQIKTDNSYMPIPLNYPTSTSVQYNPRVDYIQNLFYATHDMDIPDMQLPYSGVASENVFLSKGLMQ